MPAGCRKYDVPLFAGEWQYMQVAIKVLSSQGNETNMSADLFESLLSANMHHPNVVRPPILNTLFACHCFSPSCCL